MKKEVTKKKFAIAEEKMNTILAIVDKKGGFDKLSKKELAELEKQTQIVKAYENLHYVIPLPQTLKGIIELKMFENKLKQKELAKMLNTTDTKLSEIMNNKRKPSLSFIQALHKILGIDGNLLLRIA
ncbi:MAG: helix-turn-helix domain-containing protein [Bacteroidetes bacterium]|nr:helix-turn-helix domain-containing protein [Bacteroidota bacterium]